MRLHRNGLELIEAKMGINLIGPLRRSLKKRSILQALIYIYIHIYI